MFYYPKYKESKKYYTWWLMGLCFPQFTALFQLSKLFFFLTFCLFRATPLAYGGSQARSLIGAVASSLRQSHSNARSKLCLQPTSQLKAMPDPEPTERGQGIEPSTSWFPVRFISTAPQWELLFMNFLKSKITNY